MDFPYDRDYVTAALRSRYQQNSSGPFSKIKYNHSKTRRTLVITFRATAKVTKAFASGGGKYPKGNLIKVLWRKKK